MRKKGFVIFIFIFVAISFSVLNYENINHKPHSNVQAVEVFINEDKFASLGNEVINFDECDGRFKLKTLIIEGKFDASAYKNAVQIDETTILSFETEYETELAYKELIKLPNIKVLIDAEEQVSSTGDYSHFYDDWGYDAIEVAPYMEYLEENEVANGEETVVVVIDGGVNTSHNYLKDRILKDASGNYVGFAATNLGEKVITNYTYSGYEFEDDKGHGTHVAGIICNSTPSNVKILPVKLSNSVGEFTISIEDVLRMFSKIEDYSKIYNIVCVNMSWGGYWTGSFINMFDYYMDRYLIQNDIIPIASAGNDHINADSHYPSAFEDVVCVSALKKSGTSAVFDSYYSNYGTTVDISAPGTSVLSCGISDTNSAAPTATAYKNGTSMATPYVSAVVALLSIDPAEINQTASKIKSRLYSLTIDLGNTGWDERYGHGMVSLKHVFGNITYTQTDTVVTYDGLHHNIELTDIGASNYTISYRFETEDEFSTTISDNSNYKNVTNGEKKVFFKITASGYKETSSYGFLTINKADLGIELNDQEHIYGNEINLDTLAYTVTAGNVYGADDLGVSLSTTATATSEAGTIHEITGLVSNGNYNCTITDAVLTVVKRPIDITLLDQTSEYGDSITFDKNAYVVTSDLKVVNNDDLELQFLTSARSTSPVGSYSLFLNGYNSNYIITESGGRYVIEHKTVVITSSQSGCYGTVPSLNQSNFSTDKVVNKSSLSLVLTTNVTIESDVGNYPIEFSTTNTNFIISDQSVGTYYVYAKPITITATGQTATYGDTDLLDITKFTVSNDGIINNDTVNIVLSTTATKTSGIGNYTIDISCSGLDVGNYDITKQSGILTINKRPITVTAHNQTSMYGETVRLDQTKFSITNLANDDLLTPTLSTSATKYDPVGDYEIAINCRSTNYDITLVPGTMVVTQRKITITVGNQSAIFGERINLKANYIVSSTLKIANNDSLNIKLSTTATNSSPVGTYPITLSYSNDNYDIEVVEGVFTITSQTLRIILLNQEGFYGDTVSLDNTKFTVNIENYDVESLGVVITTTATSLSPVGSYPLTATCSNPNVELTLNDATYTVKQRLLTLSIDQQTFTYGEVDFDTNAYSLGNIVNGDDVSVILSTTVSNESKVGNDYKITATCSNGNYSLPEKTGKLIIEPRELTITLNNQSGGVYGAIIFNENDYSLSEQPINNDLLNIKLSTTATNLSSIGSNYDITFTYNNANYIVTGENAKFTINPRPVEIEIKQTSVYGDTVVLDPNDYSVTSSYKLVGDDDLMLELSTTATNTSAPGKYDIQFESANNNYFVTANVKQLEIVQREIIISAESLTEDFVYGNKIELDQTKYTISNLINDDELTVSLLTTANSSSHVGKYSITPKCVEDSVSIKYSIVYERGFFEIVARKIDITMANQETFYGEAIELQPLYTITSDNKIVNGDELNIVLKTDATSSSPIGKYDIWLEYDNDNYTIEITNGVLEIKQCDMIITINEQSSVYGDDIVLDQTKFDVNIEIDKLILGVTLKTSATNTSDVGDNYEIYLEYTNTNYDIVVKKAKFIITPRPININILDQTCEYGNIVLDNTKFTLSEQPIGELEITLTTTASSLAESGSKHGIDFNYQNPNYYITASQLGSLTITPRTIKINTYQFSYYGDQISLNNDDYTISLGSIVNDDNLLLTMTCSVDEASIAGKYNVSFVCGNANYDVIADDAIYEILPRKISISIIQQKQYGDEVEIDNSDYVIDAGDLVNGDSLDLVLQTNAKKFDGISDEYHISILSSNPNYDISLLVGKFEITKRKLVISSIQNVVYGNVVLDENNYIFVEGSKAFEEDNLNLTFTTNAVNTSNVGEYDLFVSTNNEYYEILLDSLSKVKVTPRLIKLKLTPSQSVYGDNFIVNQNYQIVTGSLVNNDILNLQFSTLASYKSDVGIYEINCFTESSNYDITLTDNTHTITPRKITIKLKNQTSPHGLLYEIDQTKYEITEGTLVEGSNLNMEIYSDGEQFSFMGKYDLMAKSNNKNYDVEVIDAKLTLTPSVEDFGIVLVVAFVMIFGVVAIVKRKKEKQKNKELFDKYIKW